MDPAQSGGRLHSLHTIRRWDAPGATARPTNLEDYVRKAQLIAYDNERAMFEAYGRNKYKATGVIKWMLNNAWPSLAWHLYDYYLEAGSGYYGTKKSLEPLACAILL